MRGIAGGAGEFGHMVIDPNGSALPLRQPRLPEVYASFREPLAEAERRLRQAAAASPMWSSWRWPATRCAGTLIARTGEAGGHGLGLIGSVFNPPLVVVSGRLALAGDILMEAAGARASSATP